MNKRSFPDWIGAVPRAGWLVAGMFVLAFLSTWIMSQQSNQGQQDERLLTLREATFDLIGANVTSAFSELTQTAASLASSDGIIEGFRFRTGLGDNRNESLVRLISEYRLPERWFVEIYDQAPTLLAWNGPALPIDPAVQSQDFLLKPVEQVAKDGTTRTAIVVWYPIVEGSKVLGAVRMGRIVESFVPIKNDYLRDYSWDEEWSRRLGLAVSFEFGDQVSFDRENERALRSSTGKVMGKVVIDLPSGEAVASANDKKYQDILVFWAVLFAAWLTILFTRWLWRTYAPSRSYDEGSPGWLTMRRLGVYFVFLIAVRWLMLSLDAPGRWQQGKTPFAPLFDAQHLASDFGFGAFRTIGDLFISSIFVMLCCVIVLRVTLWVRTSTISVVHFDKNAVLSAKTVLVLGVFSLVFTSLAALLYQAASHTIIDSTLDYFARSGLLPERLILVVFSALLMITFSGVLVGGRFVWVALYRSGVDLSNLPAKSYLLVLFVILCSATAVLFEASGFGAPLPVVLILVFAIAVSAWTNPIQPAKTSPIVALRHIVPIVIATSMVLFPMLEMSADRKVELRMKDAAVTFLEEKDSRVMFAIAQVLEKATHQEFAQGVTFLTQTDPVFKRNRMDSLAEESTRGFLLSALSGFDVTVTLHETDGTVMGRYGNVSKRIPRSTRDLTDQADFELFREMYAEIGASGPMMEKLTGTVDQNRFRYAGFQYHNPDNPFYILIRAEQRALSESAATPFPKVLSPSGYYGDRYTDLSVAEFMDGVLLRTQGVAFGRSFLEAKVQQKLLTNSEVWMEEEVRNRSYQTYYRTEESLEAASSTSVIAVRRLMTNFFDQLYHLLRVVVAGMFLALPFYVGGLIWRMRRKGTASDPRYFRDRVLNAFFSVGLITVLAMGFVGLGVVTGENERAIESWLRQHLDRVEEALQMASFGEELPYKVLDRISVDSLAARVGLDLIVYNGVEVDQASRPELIRDRLIEKRLPIEAYQALFFDGFRFVTVQQELGTFEYKAGYRALTDERGRTRYVVSIPTLPEQERIEEERARTVAYLFGALLLLVLVVMVTASFLASSLSRPIAQLRAGLQAVAAGHFERISNIESRDEIADLVDSFNTMQDQLEESQRLIGQQERQLAWKEMARQVAHEIKNPLTPMKLSIQHLRSAFQRRSAEETDHGAFAEKFNRTTTTLIEQIDTLARIANEFSSFGRMPTHIREEVDVNAVIREAVDLMQAEENVEISMALGPGEILVQADREALRRVYVNFLKNAIQAVPEDRLAKIEVTSALVESDGGRHVVSKVTDNGTGIPRNLWEKIFVPSFSTKTSGTGLGLAIARKTIENMDGEIGFDTRFEKGTTFWIKIPLMSSNSRV